VAAPPSDAVPPVPSSPSRRGNPEPVGASAPPLPARSFTNAGPGDISIVTLEEASHVPR
jgi:hypothetical protein